MTTLFEHSPTMEKFFSQFLRDIVGVLLSFRNGDWGIILFVSAKGVIVMGLNGLGTRLTEQAGFGNDFIEIVFVGVFVVNGTWSVKTDFEIGLEFLAFVAFGAVVYGEIIGIGHGDAVTGITV